jgi:hypothetical protein
MIELDNFIDSFLETEDTLNFRILMNENRIKELNNIK